MRPKMRPRVADDLSKEAFTQARVVARGGVEPPTFRFSVWAARPFIVQRNSILLRNFRNASRSVMEVRCGCYTGSYTAHSARRQGHP